MKVALCFSQYGPYHHARAKALRELVGAENFLAVQIAVGSRTYAWKQSDEGNVELVTLCGGEEEDAGFLEVFLTALRLWRREKVTAALLPSYSPATSLALLLAAKAAGLKCVMMNESHAGTERAKGWKRWIKKRLVSLFDAALVGGLPQKRHFTALGMNPEKIFTGYDAIDNDFFTREAEQVRLDADGWRLRLGLPHRYILSLGRLVEKKNLGCLIEAYAALCKRLGAPAPALVFVGSGDQEPALRNQCTRLGLHVVDLTGQREKAEGRSQKSEDRSQMSEVRDQMSASRSQQAEVRSSDLRSPTPDLFPQISHTSPDLRPPTSDLFSHTSFDLWTSLLPRFPPNRGKPGFLRPG